MDDLKSTGIAGISVGVIEASVIGLIQPLPKNNMACEKQVSSHVLSHIGQNYPLFVVH